MSSLITVGIIGYRKQAAKLISLLEENSDCEIKFIYHPTKSINDKRGTNNFSDLYDCDAVVIASPNDTHFDYIEKLCKNFDGYIFCEKPPVTNFIELEKLQSFDEKDKTRIFFNFMLRFGKINQTLKNRLGSDEIGEIVHIDVVGTKGLAFKEEYIGSWRADGEKNLHNMLDASTIHFLDLFNLHLGKFEESFYFPTLISKKGTAYDTVYVVLKYSNGVTLSILNSYACPLITEISVIGTNGVLTIRGEELVIFSPRDTFDSNGYFTYPPVFYKKKFTIENDVNDSLKFSMDYFITHVKEKTKIDLNHFETSVTTNRLILKLKNS